MFLAGSETTSSTIEWVMVELLRHSAGMAAAKESYAASLEKATDSRDKTEKKQ